MESKETAKKKKKSTGKVKIRKIDNINAGEDMEWLELPYTAGRCVKQYNYTGELGGGFF